MPSCVLLDKSEDEVALAEHEGLIFLLCVLRVKPLAFYHNKLSPPWEGPFIVSRALCDRNAYYLIDARKSKKRKKSKLTSFFSFSK